MGLHPVVLSEAMGLHPVVLSEAPALRSARDEVKDLHGRRQPLASSSSTCIATVTSRSSSSSAALGSSVSAHACSSPRA